MEPEVMNIVNWNNRIQNSKATRRDYEDGTGLMTCSASFFLNGKQLERDISKRRLTMKAINYLRYNEEGAYIEIRDEMQFVETFSKFLLDHVTKRLMTLKGRYGIPRL
ncbi:MAG: hypothetical protein ACXV5H_04135 [Halobacteriota archaeon]